MTPHTAIMALCVFLIVMGVISIIGSLSDLSDRKTEAHSDLETKWFKWKAPVRLVFELICIALVIVVLKTDFLDFSGNKSEELNKKVNVLSKENAFLKEKLNIKDSIQNYYYLTLENETGTSALQGKVLFSNNYLKIAVKGATLLSEDKKAIGENIFPAETGNKYYIKFNNELWGINILEADIHASSRIVKLEVYKE